MPALIFCRTAVYVYYRKWQEHLFENISVEELSEKAAEYRENKR
jgi:hypothetical protein